MVPWLRLHSPNVGGLGSIPGQGTKIPHAARKTWFSQINWGEKKKNLYIDTWMFIAALLVIARRWKPPKYSPMDERIDKGNAVYLYNGILFGHRKE